MSELVASVVVPTYNRLDRLPRVLQALADQDLASDAYEVIVVSDGSTDGTDEYLRSGDAPGDVVAVSQANQGPGPARNAGVARARGKLIVFVDDDIVAEPDLVSQHVRSHCELGADGRLVVMGPMLSPPDVRLSPWVQWEQDKITDQYEAMERGEWEPTFRQFFTGNASLHRDVLDEAGGFDDRFRRAEDVELSYRLDRAGCRFAFNPTAIGWHYAERSFASWRRNARDYGVNDVVFSRDHGRPELLQIVRDELPQRHALVRAVVRAVAGRRRLAAAAQALLDAGARASAAARLDRPTSVFLSASYNVAYYHGVADELGGAEAFRRAILDGVPGEGGSRP